jgi:hypothetical protein
MNKKTLALVSAGLLALSAAGSASAYTKLSPARRWDVVPVAIDINTTQSETSITDGDYGRTAILDALNDQGSGWDAAGSGDIVYGYTTNLGAVQGDGYPTIEFNDPINVCTGSCLAATMTGFWSYSAGTESIDDADVYVDSATSFTSEDEDTAASCGASEIFIEGVLQHEVGHVIGLGHSTKRAATMYASVGTCDNTTDELATDDFNGLNSLY